MTRWRISIPVHVYDDRGCFIYRDGDRSGNEYNIGQRVEIEVKAESAPEALAVVGDWISNAVGTQSGGNE